MTAEERDEIYEQFRQEGKIGKQEFINIAMKTIDDKYNSSKTYEKKGNENFPPTPINNNGSTTEFNDPENPNKLTKEEIENRERQMIIENIKNNPNAYEISDEELENIDNLSLKELESITPSIRILTQNIANRDAQLDRR